MKYFAIFILGAIFLSSCDFIDNDRISGNGKIITQTYDYKNFSTISVDHGLSVTLKQDSSFSVKAETDENLIKYLDLSLREGNLVVKRKNNISLRPSGKIKVFVSAPNLDKINVSGASSFSSDGKFSQDKRLIIDLSEASSGNFSVKAPVIDMEASEASSLTINGESRDIKLHASEASTISAFNLKAENGEARASEASTIRIFSSVTLKLNASEASSIRYRGNANTTPNSREASSIKKDD